MSHHFCGLREARVLTNWTQYHEELLDVTGNNKFQVMANCWFGLAVWVGGLDIWDPEIERDCYFGVPLESQTTN